MCTGVEIAAIAAAAAGTASAVDQKKAADRAEKRQKKANRVEKAKAEAQRSIERRRAINEARRARQANIASSQGMGILGMSSALQGAQGALGANLATSLASENRSFVSGQQSFDLRQSAASTLQNSRANAAIAGAVSSGIMQGASFASKMPSTQQPQAPEMIAKPTAGTSYTPQPTFLSPYL